MVTTNVADQNRSHSAVVEMCPLESEEERIADRVLRRKAHELEVGQESQKARRLRLMSSCRGREGPGSGGVESAATEAAQGKNGNIGRGGQGMHAKECKAGRGVVLLAVMSLLSWRSNRLVSLR